MAKPGTKNTGASPKKPRGRPWKKGDPSPNPKGRPKTGETWADIFKALGNMTGDQVAEWFTVHAREFAKLEGVRLKDAVGARVYLQLLHEPNGALLKSLMDRSDGLLAQKLEASGPAGGPMEILVRYADAGHSADSIDAPEETPEPTEGGE